MQLDVFQSELDEVDVLDEDEEPIPPEHVPVFAKLMPSGQLVPVDYVTTDDDPEDPKVLLVLKVE